MSEDASTSPTQVATLFFEALGRRDLEAMSQYYHPDAFDDFVAIGQFRGSQAIHDFFAELFAAIPDFSVEVVHMIGDSEHAVVQWHATGTFTGAPFQGIHATGRAVELRGCDVMRVQDGKLKDTIVYYDGLGFARQIGLLPREGSPADKAMTAAFNAGIDLWARIRKPAGAASQ